MRKDAKYPSFESSLAFIIRMDGKGRDGGVGLNRHIVGDARAHRKGEADSILALCLALRSARVEARK